MYIVRVRERDAEEWREDSRYDEQRLAETQAARWRDAGREADVVEVPSAPEAPAAPDPNPGPASVPEL